MLRVAPHNGNDFFFNRVLHHWLIDNPIIDGKSIIFN